MINNEMYNRLKHIKTITPLDTKYKTNYNLLCYNEKKSVYKLFCNQFF